MSRANIIGLFFLVAALSVVSVRGQGPVVCRASFNCAGGTGDDLGVAVNGTGCCLDNPNALAYSPQGSEDCIACVVVGFIDPSFSGLEQGPGHSVPVGYLKGGTIAGQNLVFDVRSTPGTAREGSQFDYTVNTLRTRALANGQLSNVVLTFRVDSIAQEPNETFTLTLDPLVQPNPREGLFFRNTIEVTIRDSDNVEFAFTEDDFRANEPDSSNPTTFLPVLVSKSARIASRVELVVVPLTVQDARASSLPLPPNIPEDDQRSPPFANLADFNSTNITIVFEPDEDVEVNEGSAPIFITDDAINEATEQVFVAELILVSSLDPATVDLTVRPSTLCRIIDNDPIRIGFLLPSYTYLEPQFDEFIDEFYVSPTGRPENGPIFLAKENNVTSEQTFLVSFQVTDSAPSGTQSATIDQDYRFSGEGQTSETEFFFPNQQRIPFLFELRTDTFPEGTEAFQASVSPEDTRDLGGGLVETFPTSLNPEFLAPDIFITILDDDPIIIGFTNTSYSVDEGIGTFQVEVRVFSPPDDQPLPASVDLVIQSVSGSAIGGNDYQELIALNLDVFLTFNDAFRQHPFDVTIIDDSLFERDVEDFTLELRFDPTALDPPPSNVILSPNVSTVNIIDDDTVVIGFLNTFYTVNECDAVANIQIGVIQGSLERPVTVRFSTNAISASDGSDYGEVTLLDFVFDSTTLTVDAPVLLVNDTIFELTEQFGASLAFPGAPPPRVTLAPDAAQVTILDDDVLTFGFDPIVYSESESVGSLNLGVSFISGDAGQFVPHLNASTVDGTATGSGSGGEADYTSVVDQTISFTSANRRQDLTVQILSDDFTELNENFTAVLSSVFLADTAGGAAIELTDQERARLIVNPDTATINILDDDVATIGFVDTTLSISENGGEIEFEIAVLDGNLRFDVSVDFATADGAALAGLDYEATSRSLTFNDQSRQSVFVPIINDTLFENPENFFGRLSAGGVLPPNVRLAPIEAIATIIDDEGIVIGFDPVSYNVNEPDGAVTLRVRLLEGSISPGRNILVRLRTTDGSAQAPFDYHAISQVLTFSSSVNLQTRNVSIIDDNLLEIDEIFRASLALVNPVTDSRVQLRPDLADITIFDEDEAVIGFVPDNYTVTEGTDLFANLNVVLISGELGREVLVNIDTQDGSAEAGSDFVGITGMPLIFDQTINSIVVQVSIMNDDALEVSPEDFTAILSSIVPRLTLLPDVATVDILDDDPVTFGFSDNQYNVNENASFVTVTILQTSGGPLDREVLITLETGDGTAISSGEQDFEAHSVDLTFGPSVTQQDVMITIIDDLRLEHDEQFNSFVSLTAADPAVTLSPSQASITIFDNDRVIIGFDEAIYNVSEDAGQAFVVVEVRNGILRRPVEVTVNTADDSALDGSDYNAIVPMVLTFDRDNSSFSIPIDIIDDLVHERREQFFGGLVTSDEDVIFDRQQTRVRIEDNDVVTFRFRQPMYMFMENVGTGTVCVDKIGETDQNITVTVTGATQFGALSEMLVFPPNLNSSCIEFDVMDDDIALEDPEEFTWTLLPPPTVPRVVISGNTTRVVIIDDDILILNLVKAEDIPEAIGAAQACVNFSNPFARSFEISPGVGRPPNSTAMAIATPGADYGAAIASIMANPGDSQACFNIEITDDVLVEETLECLMASFTAESLPNLEIGTSSSVCCIMDDDTVVIGFNPDEYFVNEEDGTVSLTVEVLAGELARAVSVNFFTQDGTATSSAPADFVGVAESSPIILQFSPTDLSLRVTVTIEEDDISENAEQFAGLLSSFDSAVILAPSNASVEIRDRDPVTIGFDPEEYFVNEADGSVSLMVRLIGGVLEREAVVSFETSPGSATSAAPADYEGTVRQLTFSPAVGTVAVPVTIFNDDIHEDNEIFFGNLRNPDQQTILNPDTAVVTIIDIATDPITIGFERTMYIVDEGGQTEVCAILISGTLEKEVLVSVGSSDGTANVGADYNAVAETLTFDAGTSRACFNTSAVQDDLLEDDEDYSLTLTSDEPGLTLAPDVATVTIPDDDPIVVGLTNTTFLVTEGPGALVEVCARVFEGMLERNAIVTLQTMDGTALSQGAEPDYVSLSVELTFTPSMTEICQNVMITNDDYYEDPEDLTVRLTTGDPDVTLMPDMGTITIVDDEQIVIGFERPSYVTSEMGVQQEVCAVIVSGNLRTTVAVEFNTADGEATAPADYIATTATFTFSGTQNRDCVNVPINEDNILEVRETFSGNLDTSAPRVTLQPDVTVITITDMDVLPIGFIDAPYTTQEASGFVTVSVGVTDPRFVLSSDYVVTLETNDIATIQNAARGGLDYEPLSINLTFNDIITRIDLNVTILDDSIVEGTEEFEAQLTAVTMGLNVELNPQIARLFILDDPQDRVRIGLTETLIRVSEDVGVREVCAEVFEGELERDVEVMLSINPDTATAPDDFLMESFILVFSENIRGPLCNNVTIVNDGIYENEERLTFDLSTTDSSVDLDPASGVMIIEDEDNVVIGWVEESYQFSESAMQARICAAVLSGSLAVTLPVLGIDTRDGTATRATPTSTPDYIPTPNPTDFTFSMTNMGPICTTIPIVDDNLVEQTIEDFFADLAFAAGSAPDRVTLSPAITTINITDDDRIVIGFLETSYTVLESDGNAQLMIGVIGQGDLETDIVIDVSTSDDTAISPDDYTSVLQTLTFRSRLPSMTVLVPIIDDLLDEEDLERFTASLTLVTDNPRVTIAPPMAEVLIRDNDVVVIGFERTMYSTPENDSVSVMVCASVRPPPSLAKTVEVLLTSMDGTAMAPGDYESVTMPLTFSPSITRHCVEFTGKEDGIVESNENFTVTLTSNDEVDLTPDVAVVTIVEGVVIMVGFVEQMYTFVESQGIGIIQVRKDAVSDEQFMVRVVGGPSTSSPIVQSAAAIDEIITFEAGPSAPDVISIVINITDDLVALEATESYIATLEILGTPASRIEIGQLPTHFPTTNVSVLDDDAVTVGFESPGVPVQESSGQFMMCVVRDREALQDITVTISSEDGTAISDVDYVPSGITTTVTIPASDPDMSECFTGPIINDLIALEPNETFSLKIDNISPDNRRINTGIDTTVITIIDDDVVRVMFEQPQYIFREESGLATVCLVKDLETATSFEVNSTTVENTALDVLDYMGGTFGVTFGTAAGDSQCINIILVSDNEREDVENFFVDVNLNNMGAIRAGDPSRTTVGIEDTGIPANDTVIGDPLMTVPILVQDSVLQMLNATRLSLCYEIHGRADAIFNLVTDECATVNAHYHDLTNYLNVIDQIGVRAVDDNKMCRNIQVDVNGCAASIDGTPLAAGARYSSGGIYVRSYPNRVRIAVPNCNELQLIMWVICETRTLEDPFGDGQVTGDMIKFVVMRGLNFGHRKAHGLLGQFWNIPVSVEPFKGVDRNGNPVPQRYVVNITSSFSNEDRSYTGWLYDLTWSFEEGPCLYVGNRQAGPIYEVREPNDPIIEGRYSEYLVQDLFSEEEFKYTLFNEDNCLGSPVVPTAGLE